MANYYITLLTPAMKQFGSILLQKIFIDKLLAHTIGLDNTASILLHQLNSPEKLIALQTELIEMGIEFRNENANTNENANENANENTKVNANENANTNANENANANTNENANANGNIIKLKNNKLTLNCIINNNILLKSLLIKTIILLLQTNIRLDTFHAKNYILPETLQLDCQDLSQIRDSIDQLSLQTVLYITNKQIINKLRIKINYNNNEFIENEIEYLHRLDIILAGKL